MMCHAMILRVNPPQEHSHIQYLRQDLWASAVYECGTLVRIVVGRLNRRLPGAWQQNRNPLLKELLGYHEPVTFVAGLDTSRYAESLRSCLGAMRSDGGQACTRALSCNIGTYPAAVCILRAIAEMTIMKTKQLASTSINPAVVVGCMSLRRAATADGHGPIGPQQLARSANTPDRRQLVSDDGGGLALQSLESWPEA